MSVAGSPFIAPIFAVTPAWVYLCVRTVFIRPLPELVLRTVGGKLLTNHRHRHRGGVPAASQHPQQSAGRPILFSAVAQIHTGAQLLTHQLGGILSFLLVGALSQGVLRLFTAHPAFSELAA